MGLITWKLTSDEILTDVDRQKIANEILEGNNGGIIYSIIDINSNSLESNLHYINQCKILIKQGNLLTAVKYYRDKTGAGLKEAKDFIDNLRKEI